MNQTHRIPKYKELANAREKAAIKKKKNQRSMPLLIFTTIVMIFFTSANGIMSGLDWDIRSELMEKYSNFFFWGVIGIALIFSMLYLRKSKEPSLSRL